MGGRTRTRAERRALYAFVCLTRASESVDRAIHGHLRDEGLSVSQFGVLEALLHLGPLAQGELGRKILKSPNNLTTVIDNLERDELVERRPDPADRRVKTVALTRAGRRVIERVFPVHAEEVARALGALSATEQKELAHLCKKLGVALAGGNR